jgi:signal transduction histidine kinase
LAARAAAGVRTDAGALAAIAGPDREESLAQLLDVRGEIVAAVGQAWQPALTREQVQQTLDAAPVLTERSVAGIDGVVRLLARPASEAQRAAGAAVLVVGQSLNDRNEALAGVVTSFAGGGAVAVLLASLVGYLLARAGLAPVEAIRRRAVEVSLTGGEGLPLPSATDEVRRLAQTLNEMLDRLRASFERERRFVADASHELRTPIAVVKTELEATLRSGDFGPQVRESLVAAVEECDQLAQLADDLLVLARLAADGLPLRPQPIDPQALLAGIQHRFCDRAAERGRSLRVEVQIDDRLGDGDGRFVADPDRVRQAVANLVDNALRHGRGDVRVLYRRVPDGHLLQVRDRGEGFPAEVAGHAFDRFARGDLARTRGGAGLGLAIVAAIAAAHRGTARIMPGPGATVQFWLPDRS